MPDHGRLHATPEDLLLCWDTSTMDGSIVLAREGEVLAETRFRTVKGHASWLMPLVASTLEGIGIVPGDIGAVASGIGPGTYTGVKVGVATAKALALALGVEMVPLPTLDLLAAHAPDDAGPVLAVMGAHQGMVYLAGYAGTGALPERVTDYECMLPEGAGRLAELLGPGRLTVIGQAPDELMRSIADAGVEAFLADVPSPGFPTGARIARMATGMLLDGLGVDPVPVAPIYLKKPV